MIERQDATSNLYRCDFPHCFDEHRTYASGFDGTSLPAEWKRVRIGDTPRTDDDYFILCANHAKHEDTVRLVVALTNREPDLRCTKGHLITQSDLSTSDREHDGGRLPCGCPVTSKEARDAEGLML